MQYIVTILLVLMTAAFITCGVLLWRRRAEKGVAHINMSDTPRGRCPAPLG